MLTIEKVYQENKKSVDAWKKACRTAGGKLKRNIHFGTQCKEPLVVGQTLIWIGASPASSDELKKDQAIDLVDQLSEKEPVRVFSEDKQLMDRLKQQYPRVVVEQEREALNLLATSENVVSIAMLPTLYRKRAGQRHIHLVTDSDLNESRYERAINGLGCIFSADWIVARSLEEMNGFIETYQLNGAYKGSLTWSDQENLADNLQKILNNVKEDAPCYSCDNGKKNILLFCDCCPNIKASEYCQHLVRIIDLDIYDITIVYQCYNEQALTYQFVDELDERIRVFSRTGSFSCDQESYVAIQVINEIILDVEDPTELLKLVPSSTLENEIDRILPGMEFDSFVYCARDRKMWTLLSSGIKASHKTMLQLEYKSSLLVNTENEELLLRFRNKAKLISTIFHSVGFANSEMMEGLAPYLGSTDVWAWNSVAPILKSSQSENIRTVRTLVDGKQMELVRYEGKTRNKMINAYIYSPFSKDKPNYLTFLRIDEAIRLFQTLDETERDYTISIYVENSASYSPSLQLPESTDSIRIIDMLTLVNSSLASYYVSKFDGYVDIYDTEDNSLRALALEMGLPVYREESGKLQSEDVKTDNSEQFNSPKYISRIYGS